MDVLRAHVTDSYDFDQNTIIIQRVRKHLVRQENLYIYSDDKGSPSAHRFYVGDKPDNESQASHIIPHRIIADLHFDEEEPILLLNAGNSPEAEEVTHEEIPLHSIPIRDFANHYINNGTISQRLGGVLCTVAELKEAATFKQVIQKYTRQTLQSVNNTGPKFFEAFEIMCSDTKLHLRQK